ncbi:amidohydrolase family protein [Croceiramulus getboli]|nr:amidohydrolase family protein [Flavobacteriaceae bacterium YJPT1-3]
MNHKFYSFLGVFLMVFASYAQDYFPKNDGVKASKNNNYTAFTNAVLHLSPDQTIQKGTLLIQNGKVVEAGRNVKIPNNSITVDLNGQEVYPAFVEVMSGFGVKKPERPSGGGRSPIYDATREGYYWNDHIRPETNALDHFDYDSKTAKTMLEAGFGAVNAHRQDAIARGTGVLVALNQDGDNGDRILEARSAQYFSFDKSDLSQQSYPTSIMGATALMRQLYYDMDWYAKGNVETKDLALEALIRNRDLPQIFVGDGLYDALRIDKISDQFNLNYVIVGGGDEYQRIGEIKNTNATYILPVNFPDAYDVENPYQASYVSLAQMKHWNLAPTNPAAMEKAGMNFAITTHGLKSAGDLMKQVQQAMKYGLSEKKALAALTTVPAQIIGKSDELGTLKSGSWANFIVTSGPLFDEDTKIYETWVQGNKTVVNNKDVVNIDGEYTLQVNNATYNLTITNSMEKAKATVKQGETKMGSEFNYSDGWMNLAFAKAEKDQFIRLVAQGQEKSNLTGKAILADGTATTFTARRTGDTTKDKKEEEDEQEKPVTVALSYPNNAFGFAQRPKQQDMLFKNATVWTNAEQGIMKQTDVLVQDGKIAKVGKDLSARGALVIDATGKHLTTGIVDEHSHIAAFSINEAGQNSSAEVEMADAINPDDIDIYRNLAGGVTAIQLLHGSANPIGGQSAILKLKWGAPIDEMLMEDKKFIKFALGENVKQSNWQSYSRFPQSRMGVEQLYVDYFQRAKEYEALKNSGQAYRRDQEMETLVEILNAERFIACHSYVQSEINMLMKVAESFNFRINTFTHILEGYKVADKMAEHGVGGSTFSDWWAYKYEVNDAIPYNAAIMHSQGVVTAINSDDAEMSRRLNQEAAKTVKYGGVSEEDAWKFVTLNPAKLLHLDDKVGTIVPGKDADLVLWNGHPMDIATQAEKTMIEGVVYFDMERDKQLRETLKKEKNQLTTLMLKAKNKGLKTQAPKKKDNEQMHCNTLVTFE